MLSRWSGVAGPTCENRCRSIAGQEVEYVIAGVVAQHHTFVGPASPRSTGASVAALRSRSHAREPRPCRRKDVATGAPGCDVCFRIVDQIEMEIIGGLGRVRPGDKTVIHQHDAAQTRPGRARIADFLGEQEAGSSVGDDRHVRAQAAAHGLCSADRCWRASRWRRRGCGSRTASGMNACSNVSIDGRGEAGSMEGVLQVGDHLLVRHLTSLCQRQHVIQPDAGEVP